MTGTGAENTCEPENTTGVDYLMSEIATAKINSFAPIAAQTDFAVSPSEEAVFILTSGQLQDLIKEAIQPLQDRIGSLEARITAQDEKITSLESTQEQDTNRICVDIAHDRQRLTKLEQKPSTPTGAKTLARITKIDEILKARGSTTLQELERILKISPKEMNRLLAKLDMRRYEVHARPGDDREKVLRLKVQIR
jgi:hypothetical protein